FGVGGESWVIDLVRRPADPASSSEDWDDLVGWLLDLAYPLADGSGRLMKPRAVGFDSAGAPGVTQQAYDVWRRAFQRRRARMLGVNDGREAWNLVPTKGVGSANAVRLQVRRPDSARKDRTARAQGAVPLAQFGANAFKDDLVGQLARAEAGPGFVHFPAALRSARPPHVFFEQLVAEARKPNGAWEKIAPRNEALDLMVGCHVLAHLHGLARIDWNRPPPWAAEWGRNPAVVASPGASSATETAGMSPGASPQGGRPAATHRPLGAMLP
ncbi:MAG: phage terminase large subunit family protein, partial [Bradyrhizobium sp.]|nr:phage terminase large subunit family protein [Bradyrhizobium sp.]